MDNKKNKKTIRTLVAVVVILSALASISIVYNFLGGFYYCRIIEYDKVLGEEQTIHIDSVGAFLCSANFSGSLVLGADISQKINIQAKELLEPLFLRARIKVNGFDFDSSSMYGFANWVEASDGYLYFNQQLNSYDKIGLCNMVKINIQMDLKSSSNYIITFIVETSETAWNYVPI